MSNVMIQEIVEYALDSEIQLVEHNNLERYISSFITRNRLYKIPLITC